MTTETFGNSVEYAICRYHKLDYNRINRTTNLKLLKLNYYIDKYILKGDILTYTGDNDKEVDFKTGKGLTISVKTNTSGYKVCPQVIGQTTKQRWLEKFHPKHNKSLLTTDEDIKDTFMTYTKPILREYVKYTFFCDYLIWVYKNKGNIKPRVIKKSNKIRIDNSVNITFTKSRETWNESNTVKFNGLSIGEIQIHKKRNCVKFRFNLMNLLKFFGIAFKRA